MNNMDGRLDVTNTALCRLLYISRKVALSMLECSAGIIIIVIFSIQCSYYFAEFIFPDFSRQNE